MKLLIKHYLKIINGKKIYHNPDLYRSQIQSLEGKECVEIIEEKPIKVTLDQHGYLRGGIYGACANSEYFAHFENNDKIHEFFADMFLSYTEQVVTPDKSYIRHKVRSSADLTKKEYSEFIERVRFWCDENGISTPDSDQYHSRYYKTIKTTK